MKQQIRAIGFDDAAFSKQDKHCLVVGAVCRPDGYLEGLVSTSVEVDGKDALQKIASVVKSCRFRPQLKCVFLQGFTIAGFNMIDIKTLSKLTGLPVISILRKKPSRERFDGAMRNFPDKARRAGIFEKNNKYIRVSGVYVNFAGTDASRAKLFLKAFLVRSKVPEPLRIAHIVASGVSKGKSTKNK